MKLPLKIALIIIGTVVVGSLLISLSNSYDSRTYLFAGFAVTFGIAGLAVGAICLLVGIILLLVKENAWAQGFLIAGGILFLAGFLSCSSMLGFEKGH
jgi:hypothetical protein